MRRIALAAVVVSVLMSPTAVSAISFGDWATRQGYSPGDALPWRVAPATRAIDRLDGIGDYDWEPTAFLSLLSHQLSSIEARSFSGLNLISLLLHSDQLSVIEADAFSGLNLRDLSLGGKISSIESGDFSGLTNLENLRLSNNQISTIESGAFDGLTNLTQLELYNNKISSIKSGAFSDLLEMRTLWLDGNLDLIDLNLGESNLSNLRSFSVKDNVNITSVLLTNAIINQTSLATLIDGGVGSSEFIAGIGELPGITEIDLSGIDFIDITDLAPLYRMDDLTDLRLLNTKNMDAVDLDVLLDNLATIEGTETEGVLYMTQADFDAFNTAGGGLLAAWDAEPGHHVAIIPEPSSLLLTMLGMAVTCCYLRH